jgi:DHA1 family bicyclomycin/chloramphenicol resistance-like MFS transporter
MMAMLLTLLLGIQPITTDLYLPALPTLQRDLAAGMGSTQLTLSALIICFGLAQLIAGPLADRHGRRPVLLGGLALYTVASIGGAVARDIDTLVAWRALQGVGMAGAVTCARSILRDLFAPQDGARVLSRALGGLGVIAMLSPLVGGLVVHWLDWHWALLLLALFGAASLAYVALRYRESVPARDPRATRFGRLWRNWVTVLRNPTFRAWTGLLSLAYGGLFVILAASSFVYIGVLGVSQIGYGLLMAGNSLCYIGGTWLCRRWLASVGLRAAVRRGVWFSLLGGLGMAAVSMAGVHTWWALFVPQCVFAVGHGVHQPCGQAGAVGPFAHMAGTAASLSGFAMMLTAFVVGLWLGQRLDDTVYPLAFGVAGFGVGLAVVGWTWVQRDGDPAPRPQAQVSLEGQP